jgi:hypothetical protein
MLSSRPIRPPKQSDAHNETKGSFMQQRGLLMRMGLGVALVVLAGASVVGYGLGWGKPAHKAITPTVVATSVAVSIPTRRPTVAPTVSSCRSAANYQDIIDRQSQAADWQAAAATANTALGLPNLCQADKAGLTQQAVVAGLKVLYSEKFNPLDVAAQQQEVDRYLALKAQAHQAGVDFPTALQVSQDAYQIGQFLLAKVAVEEAFRMQAYKPEVQRDITRTYVSILFNLGSWYTTAQLGSDVYNRGMTLLAASHQLAVMYRTGQGEAGGKLRQLTGSDERSWPQPAETPLLDTASSIAGKRAP